MADEAPPSATVTLKDDWGPRIMRLCLLLIIMFSVVLSIRVLRGCELIQYEALEPFEQTTNQTMSNFRSPNHHLLGAEATLGLFQYDTLDDNIGCRSYEVSAMELGSLVRAARMCGVFGAIFGTMGMLAMITEFVCCRFLCSRFWIVFMLLLASVAQSLTMLAMLSDPCLDRNNVPYQCEMDRESILTLVAAGMYLLATFLTCLVPRAVPLARIITEAEKNVPRDPCCYCCRNQNAKETDNEADNELTELLHASGSPTTVQLADGSRMNHSFESRAGPTLQDQSIAAYTRWMNYEDIYDKTLERFKSECGELELQWSEIQKLPVEEIGDDTLRRIAVLLSVQAHQCQLAREDMHYFEDQLKAMKSEESKMPTPSSTEKDETSSSQGLLVDDIGTDLEEDAKKNSDDVDTTVEDNEEKSFTTLLSLPKFGLWSSPSKGDEAAKEPEDTRKEEPESGLLTTMDTTKSEDFMSGELFEDAVS